MLEGLSLLLAGTVLSGISWTIHKVIRHDALLEHISESLERLEAKIDRMIERAL